MRARQVAHPRSQLHTSRPSKLDHYLPRRLIRSHAVQARSTTPQTGHQVLSRDPRAASALHHRYPESSAIVVCKVHLSTRHAHRGRDRLPAQSPSRARRGRRAVSQRSCGHRFTGKPPRHGTILPTKCQAIGLCRNLPRKCSVETTCGPRCSATSHLASTTTAKMVSSIIPPKVSAATHVSVEAWLTRSRLHRQTYVHSTSTFVKSDRSASTQEKGTRTAANSARRYEGNTILWRYMTDDGLQAIGAAADAVRMQRVVDFYEKLPRGAAPEPKARGLLGWYKNKYFGKRPSGMRM